jgi:plastocyanin
MVVSKSHTVKVINSDGYCGFETDKLQTKRGDKVTFVNATDKPVSLIFMAPDFFEAMYLNLAPEQDYTLAVSMEGTSTSCQCTVICNTAATVEYYATKPVIIIYR